MKKKKRFYSLFGLNLKIPNGGPKEQQTPIFAKIVALRGRTYCLRTLLLFACSLFTKKVRQFAWSVFAESVRHCSLFFELSFFANNKQANWQTEFFFLPKNEPSFLEKHEQPTHLIFGRVIDIVSMFYLTKNQVRGLCVGGDMAIYFFAILQSS